MVRRCVSVAGCKVRNIEYNLVLFIVTHSILWKGDGND